MPEVVDSVKELVRWLDAGTAAGKGGSRDDGGSTPALGAIREKFSRSKDWKSREIINYKVGLVVERKNNNLWV